MKKKDFNYTKLVIQLTLICKKLKQYLTDEEIAKLIAKGLQDEKH